jgi:hypothetical protein
LYEHILRIDPRITQQILQHKVTRHRDTGRHRRRWQYNLETEQTVTACLEVVVVVVDDDDDDDVPSC